MPVVKLTPEDRLEAKKMRARCFNFSLNLEESAKEPPVADPDKVDWGEKGEYGNLLAAVLDIRYSMRYDGRTVGMSGIAGVATKPECRMGGSIRRIMEPVLRVSRERGDVFSVLYPFKHEFYRKFGYEVCYAPYVSEVFVRALAPYRFYGAAKLMEPGSDWAPVRALYDAFVSDCNLAVIRTDAEWKRRSEIEPYKAQDYTYLLTDANGPAAYLRIRPAGPGKAEVTDLAWRDHGCARELMGFLYGFNAQFETVTLELPSAYRACALLVNARESAETARHHAMARVVNVPAALAGLSGVEAPFALRVTDAFMPENAGTYRVSPGLAEPTDDEPDMECDVTDLAQLCLGFLSLDGARLRPTVRVYKNEKALAAAFPAKKLYLSDRF